MVHVTWLAIGIEIWFFASPEEEGFHGMPRSYGQPSTLRAKGAEGRDAHGKRRNLIGIFHLSERSPRCKNVGSGV